MLILLEKLHSFVFQGKSECQVFEVAPACTGGNVFKNFNHQVYLPQCTTKVCTYTRIMQVNWLVHTGHLSNIMRKESTRDHVNLLLSSRHWPTVYAVDIACDVVAHMEVREP